MAKKISRQVKLWSKMNCGKRYSASELFELSEYHDSQLQVNGDISKLVGKGFVESEKSAKGMGGKRLYCVTLERHKLVVKMLKRYKAEEIAAKHVKEEIKKQQSTIGDIMFAKFMKARPLSQFKSENCI